MKRMQLREAKAKLSEAVDTVLAGEPVTITRHGTPVVMIVSIEEGRKLHSEAPRRSVVDVLLEYPGGLDLERDHTPPREIDL